MLMNDIPVDPNLCGVVTPKAKLNIFRDRTFDLTEGVGCDILQTANFTGQTDDLVLT